jgi:hypothetical protein
MGSPVREIEIAGCAEVFWGQLEGRGGEVVVVGPAVVDAGNADCTGRGPGGGNDGGIGGAAAFAVEVAFIIVLRWCSRRLICFDREGGLIGLFHDCENGGLIARGSQAAIYGLAGCLLLESMQAAAALPSLCQWEMP